MSEIVDFTVTLNDAGNGIVLQQTTGTGEDIEVHRSQAPATITFSAGPGLYFTQDCFSLSPAPPAGDFSWTPAAGTQATSLVVTDNDTDSAPAEYEYTICALRSSDGQRYCIDPKIYNKAD